MGSEHHIAGRYGRFGGRYVPEALWAPVEQVARAFDDAIADPEFVATFERWLDHRVGRPTPLSRLERISARGGGRVWLKREDLCQGGSYCVNSATLQALLAHRMGKRGVICETGTGDFGVALGSVGAALGLDVTVYMGREDMQTERGRVAHMRRLGVRVEQVDAPHRGRREATAEAMRHWMSASERVMYCASSLASPDPYPRLIEWALRTIGAEARVQLRRRGHAAAYVIAPVGSGALAAGMFSEFLADPGVRLIGVQAGGEPVAGRHSASLISGRPGVVQGTFSYALQDPTGQILTPHSIAGGMCLPVVGPQHARWAEEGAVLYASMSDREAVEAVCTLADQEGLLLSLETGHALAYALRLLTTLEDGEDVLVVSSGGGDHDLLRLEAAAESLLEHEP
jgi:tryptophan synthase beta subunit